MISKRRAARGIAQPLAQRRGEAHLLAVDDFVRQEVFDGFLDDVLAFAVAQLHVLGNARGELDELVIEKRHAAFDGGGHAHLVLLHEQFDEVGLLVGVEHAGQRGEIGFGIPDAAEVGVGRGVRQVLEEGALLGGGEGGVEIVEVERLEVLAAADEGVLQFAAEGGREKGRGGDLVANGGTHGFGQEAVEAQPALVHGVKAVAGVAAEHLVAAFAGEHHLDVFPGQFRDEIERDAGGPGDGLVFMPDQAGQRVEEIVHADDDFVVLGADGLGDLAGVGQFAEFGLLVADGEGLDGSSRSCAS